jgi:hypothetical protein
MMYVKELPTITWVIIDKHYQECMQSPKYGEIPTRLQALPGLSEKNM